MTDVNTTRGDQGVDLGSDEFQDHQGRLLPAGLRFDLTRLLTAESLRALAAIFVAIVVLRAPSRSPRGFAVLVGAILIAWAVGGLVELARAETRRAQDIIRVAFLIVGGAGILYFHRLSAVGVGRLLGAILIAGGVLLGVRAWRGREEGPRFEPLLGATLYVALGGALVAAPLSILGLAVLLLSVYWFLAGLATIVTNVRLDDRQIATSNTWQMFLEWIQTRPNTADDRAQLYDKIFFEGAEQARRLSRFFVLMGFATAIAAWGVIADSTAVVIGAMLVAPLMTPLMGTSLAMAMGWPRRALLSGGVALAGIVFAVGLSILFGWMFGPEISSVANSQVASRVAPTLVDLMIAVAAGGAGAFALSRPDVSDSLPGVAVAIALVPPLAVAGLMISQTNWAAASGAVLLFLTNLVAILVVGGIVFIFTGVVPVLRMAERSHWLKRTLGMVAILAIAVVGVLGFSAESFRRQTVGLEDASAVVADWLGQRDLTVASANYENGRYAMILTGSDRPPPIQELAAEMEDAFGEPIAISVTWAPTETQTFEPSD